MTSQHDGAEETTPPGAAPTETTETTEASAFDTFLTAGRAKRLASAPQSPVAADWADPDPAAIAGLAPARRPVDRLLTRRGGRAKSQRCFCAQVSQVCRLVQAADGISPLAARSVDDFPWHHIDVDHAARYRRLIHDRYRNVGTRNLMITVVREVMRECHRAGIISSLRLDEVLQQLPTKHPGRTSRGRRLTPDEVSALLAACARDSEPRRAARDAAIIAVLAVTGMRSSELTELTLADWDESDQRLFLAVTKSGRSHEVFLPAVAVPYLQRWKEQRGDHEGPLFTMVIGDTKRALTYPALLHLLRTRADQAAVKRFGSHDFRRTLATTLLRTHDISLVSRILGHADVASTAVYDLAAEDECRDAVETLPLPELGSQPPTDSEEE